MADPWGIVVVPAEGDPAGLTASTLEVFDRFGMLVHAHRAPLVTSHGRWRGLRLWWDGKLVPDGWWRGWRAWVGGDSPGAPCPVQATGGECMQLGKELVMCGLASRVVLLDLAGLDLVERAP